MNPRIPVAVGLAGILAGAGTTIANANGAFTGHPHLAYWFWGGAGLLVVVAVTMLFTGAEPNPPHIVAARYGEGRFGTGVNSYGYRAGESGLIVLNDGEPAYEIGVYPPSVVFGESKLRFANTITRLTKQDGEGQLRAWIEYVRGGSALGSGLFEVMRQQAVSEFSIPVLYKGAKNRWYKSICKIERDVTASGGLNLKTDFRGRTRKPKITG